MAQITLNSTGVASNGALVLQSNGTTSAISIDASQNVNFAGTAQRITADFSNATLANRLAFQSSTTNGVSDVNVLPNGTSLVSAIRLNNNSDPTNAGICRLFVSDTVATLDSNRNSGSGTYLPMTFNTGGSESLRLSATTKAVILAGGSTSANGTGIAFPATQSASSNVNTLDDYEEGTFTPSVLFGGAAVGQTGTFAGFYTKVGNQVFVTIAIALTAKGSSTGGASIGGLPFTSNSDANYRAMSSSIVWGNTITSYVYMLGLLPQSATAIDLYAATAATTGSADANPGNTNLNNTSSFRISITYQTS
jgi:hypothetical protein